MISLGSNIAPERNLPLAIPRLKELGEIGAISRAYQSSAAGPPGQPDFVNAAALLETELTLEELRVRLREIESALGRRRSGDKFAPRTIDLDLVLYDDVTRDAVKIPDPDLLLRPYLAATVAEVDPQALHPVTGESLAQIAARLGGTAQLVHRPEIDLNPATAGGAR